MTPGSKIYSGVRLDVLEQKKYAREKTASHSFVGLLRPRIKLRYACRRAAARPAIARRVNSPRTGKSSFLSFRAPITALAIGPPCSVAAASRGAVVISMRHSLVRTGWTFSARQSPVSTGFLPLGIEREHRSVDTQLIGDNGDDRLRRDFPRTPRPT